MIERRIERLSDLESELDGLLERLAPLAAQFSDFKAQRDGLVDDKLTPADERKVAAWQSIALSRCRPYTSR